MCSFAKYIWRMWNGNKRKSWVAAVMTGTDTIHRRDIGCSGTLPLSPTGAFFSHGELSCLVAETRVNTKRRLTFSMMPWASARKHSDLIIQLWVFLALLTPIWCCDVHLHGHAAFFISFPAFFYCFTHSVLAFSCVKWHDDVIFWCHEMHVSSTKYMFCLLRLVFVTCHLMKLIILWQSFIC